MDNQVGAFFIGLFVGLVVVLVLVVTCDPRTDNVRREAVKAGVARYVADEDGDPKFEWIDPKPWWRLDNEPK